MRNSVVAAKFGAQQKTENNLRRCILGFRLLCLAIIALSVFVAIRRADEDWVDRGGHVIIALSLFLTFVQFKYEILHGSSEKQAIDVARALAKEKGVTAAEAEHLINRVTQEARHHFEGVRTNVLLNSLFTAAVGEILSAFGGLVLKSMVHIAWVGEIAR